MAGRGIPSDGLEAVVGKKATQLATVASAQSPPGKVTEEKYAERTLLPRTHEKRLRAIAERSPEPVRELYRDDLIGAIVSSGFQPFDPGKNPAKTANAKVIVSPRRQILFVVAVA